MVGLCDDIIGLSAYKKMLFQFLSSFLLIYGFGTTLVFILPLSILDWGIGYYTYIILNILVLICFIMGVTNSINLVD